MQRSKKLSEIYQQLKDKYPDCVLFFRQAESYESYFEDAETCSRICGLDLDNRSIDNGPVPLVDILLEAIEGCLKKMLQAGHKVVVFEHNYIRLLTLRKNSVSIE